MIESKDPSQVLEVVRLENPEGTTISDIFAVRLLHTGPGGKSVRPLYFIKVLKGSMDLFNQEAKDLIQVNSANIGDVQKIRKQKLTRLDRPVITPNLKNNFPKFALLEQAATYKDSDNQIRGALLLHAAQGVQGISILNQALKSKTDETQEESESQSQVETKNQAAIYFVKAFGRSMGAFHFANVDKKKSDYFEMKTLVHGDPNFGNVFFDPKTTKITFIDNNTIRTGEPGLEVGKVFHRLNAFVADTMRSFYSRPSDDIQGTDKDLQKVQFVLVLANHFMADYVQQFPRQAKSEITQSLKQTQYYQEMVEQIRYLKSELQARKRRIEE